MARLVHFIGILLFFMVFRLTRGIDFCGLEDLKPGQITNKTQFMQEFEPAVRKWLSKGQSGYFVENPDKIVHEFFEIPVKDGAYWLQNVTILETYDSELIDFNIERYNESKAVLNYTYLQNVVVKADSIHKVDEDEESVSCERPLCVRLQNVKSTSFTPATFFTRCNGQTFMFLESETVRLDSYPKNCVKYDQGQPIKCDLREFNDGLIRIISELVTRSLTEGYRTLSKQVHVNDFWVLKPIKHKC